ncbi:MAG: hypothetical protein Q7S43_02990 [bacterium]|nr:hypothetical protein [bacterium]MDO8496394.1 hypothetical protein [bacterium]
MTAIEQGEFLKKAQEAMLWILEQGENPPVMERRGDALRFTANGLQFEYRPRGWHYDDNPWREANLRRVEHEEGLIVVAKCPRHGGERRSQFIIPSHPLRHAKLIDQLVGCTICSSETVVVRLPSRLHPRGGVVMASNYCAFCAEHRFEIPKSSWLPEPPRHTEDEFRGPTRRVLAETKKWAEDVECDACVTWAYASAGGGCDTHAMARRTYVR